MKVYEGKTQGTIHKYEATITLEVASNRRIYLNRAEEIKRFIKSFDIQFTAPNTIGTKDWRQYNLQVMNLDISDVEDITPCCTHYKEILPTEEKEREANCPECEGNNLNEDKTRCWDCQPER